jgi:septation ring formation regulator EzrA
MKHLRDFETARASREAAQTKSLIADLNQIVQIINANIAAEEEQAQAFDQSRPEYPVLARALIARRENLMGTIEALMRRVEVINEETCDLTNSGESERCRLAQEARRAGALNLPLAP